jgi:hypothetical protein
MRLLLSGSTYGSSAFKIYGVLVLGGPMLRLILAATILLVTSALPSSADVKCDKGYLTFSNRLNSQMDGIPGERLALLHRRALRIFDACDSGGISNADAMFHDLEGKKRVD